MGEGRQARGEEGQAWCTCMHQFSPMATFLLLCLYRSSEVWPIRSSGRQSFQEPISPRMVKWQQLSPLCCKTSAIPVPLFPNNQCHMVPDVLYIIMPEQLMSHMSEGRSGSKHNKSMCRLVGNCSGQYMEYIIIDWAIICKEFNFQLKFPLPESSCHYRFWEKIPCRCSCILVSSCISHCYY